MYWKTIRLYLKISLFKDMFSTGSHLLVTPFKMTQLTTNFVINVNLFFVVLILFSFGSDGFIGSYLCCLNMIT